MNYILISKLRQGVSSNVKIFISLGLPVATMKIGADNNTEAKNLYFYLKGLKVLDDRVMTTVKGKPELKRKYIQHSGNLAVSVVLEPSTVVCAYNFNG